jgi:hypothetical protein
MASSKKKAPKGKKAHKPAPKKPAKAAPKPSAADKAAAKKREQHLKGLEKAAAVQQKELARLKAMQDKELQKLKDLQAQEAARKEALRKEEAARKAAAKEAERLQREAARKAEAEKRAADRLAEQQKKAAEREAEKQRKAEEKAAAKAASDAAKRKIPTTSLAATPIIRPLGDAAVALAPPPPPAKPGHADHQILAALSYGMFAAVNKSFGFAGQSVVKNAALRMLEYGYKRGWLPPKSKEPVRALNEFFGRLETMGYAEKIHVAKRGEQYALEVQGLADYDAVHELRTMHYPLLPIFVGEMLQAIVDQYFRLRVTMSPIEWQEQKRGFTLPFSMHEPTTTPEISRLTAVSKMDDFEE